MASSSSKRKARKGYGVRSTKKLQTDDNEYIVFPYVVLRKVFFNLLAKDLCNTAKVCRLWREVAKHELQRRKLIVRLTPYTASFNRCNVDTHFHHTLTNKPMLAVFFNSTDVEPPACLKTHLPQSCISVSLCNYGVIMNTEHEKAINTTAYTFLPDHQDVQINLIAGAEYGIYQYNNRTSESLEMKIPRRKSFKEAEIRINETLKRVKDVKCVILLSSERFTGDRKFCSMKAFKENVKVAWGGVSEELFIVKADKDSVRRIHWLTMIISGPTVKCWSMVIRDERTAESVEERMLEMKKNVKAQKHTIGFMFSCVGRGEDWYDGVPNVETTVWKKVFPEIPLIGSFGNGEYGINSDKKEPFNMCHQYSSTFMILTYG